MITAAIDDARYVEFGFDLLVYTGQDCFFIHVAVEKVVLPNGRKQLAKQANSRVSSTANQITGICAV